MNNKMRTAAQMLSRKSRHQELTLEDIEAVAKEVGLMGFQKEILANIWLKRKKTS